MAEMPEVSNMQALLTFEITNEGDQVFIHGDPAGLRKLASILETLAANAERGDFPHEHLFASEWGGEDLSSTVQVTGNRCIPHVKLFGWPDARGGIPYIKQA
jgi:hypothetical protein